MSKITNRHVAASARRALVNAVGASILTELASAGVPSILLKGASTARWLYPDDPGRSYSDVDILVPVEGVPVAEALMRRLGFTYAHDDMHSRTWLRPRDDARIDLHWTLVGVGTPPKDTFQLLAATTEEMNLAGTPVVVLRRDACALHVALHAAQHGIRGAQPLEDLSRAVDRFSADEWRQASILAEHLRASASLAAGLRLVPAGRELADKLDLPYETPVGVALRAKTSPPLADGLVRLAQTPRLRQKVELIVSELFPSPAFLRTYSALARRGPAGLAGAYVGRLFRMGWYLAPASLALLRARRAARAAAQVDEGRRSMEPPRKDTTGT